MLSSRARQIQSAVSRRGFASASASAPAPASAPASAPISASFTASTVGSGIKVASRNVPGPTASVSLVARAGTRYAPAIGLADGLEKFAFRNTTRRSALRIVREIELLGGKVSTSFDRESVVLTAQCFPEHMPYFVELLAETTSATKFQDYEFIEQVKPLAKDRQAKYLANPAAIAVDAAHTVAFHRGLGTPLVSSSVPLGPTVTADTIAEYAQSAYADSNIAVVASGAVDPSAFADSVSSLFKSRPTGTAISTSPKTEYFGGQHRVSSAAGNAIVIAFPGSPTCAAGSAFKPEIAVLASALGGSSAIKWSAGSSALGQVAAKFPAVSISTKNTGYADAGLLTITIASADPASAADVSAAAKDVVAAVKAVASNGLAADALAKAVAATKFAAADAEVAGPGATVKAGYSLVHAGAVVDSASVFNKISAVKADQVQAAAKSMLDGKATFAAVGNTADLVFAEDIGLVV